MNMKQITNYGNSVLQIKIGNYLPKSETFIYNHIINLKNYRPIVVTQEVSNLGIFPYEPIELLPFIEKINPKFIWQVLKLKKKYNPVLIHAHFGSSGVYGLLLKKILNVPLITSFHGVDISAALKDPFWQAAYQKLFKQGDFFTGTSDYMRNQIRNAGCPQDKIRVVHVGIDLDQFKFSPREIDNSKDVHFLTVGRLVEKKGMDDTIKAFAIVNESFPSTKLHIIGEGPLRKELEKLAADLKLKDKITFRGETSYMEVIEQMQTADVFVLASKTAKNGDQEGTTMVTKEALASGMPVVATSHAGIPEVICDNINGFLVSEGDYQALAMKMISILNNKIPLQIMAETGRKHIEKNFNIKMVSKEYEKLYEEAITLSPKVQSSKSLLEKMLQYFIDRTTQRECNN